MNPRLSRLQSGFYEVANMRDRFGGRPLVLRPTVDGDFWAARWIVADSRGKVYARRDSLPACREALRELHAAGDFA